MKILSYPNPKRLKRERAFLVHIQRYQSPEQIFQADDRDHHLSQLHPSPLAHTDPKGGKFMPLPDDQCAICQDRFIKKAWIQDNRVFATLNSRTKDQPCGHWAVCDKLDCLEKYYGIRAVYLTEDQVSVLEQRNGGKHIFCQKCGGRVSKWDYGFAYDDEGTVGRTETIMRNVKGIVKEEEEEEKKKKKENTNGKTKLRRAMGCLGCVVCAPCIVVKAVKQCAEVVIITGCFWYGIWKASAY